MQNKNFVKRRPVLTGLLILGAMIGIGVLLYFKTNLMTALTPGETLTVVLDRNYKLDSNDSDVKMAGTNVGTVQSIDQEENGLVRVKLKVNYGVRNMLGSEPRAVVRPTTILGGRYYVSLISAGTPGRFGGNEIPVERTRVPIELDKVLSAVSPDAQRGLRGMTERLDATLETQGFASDVKSLLRDAPDTLQPAGVVLDGVRGMDKNSDLAKLTTDANTAVRVLSAKPGQLRSVVDSLVVTSKALGDNAVPLARTIADLPDTLRAVRRGSDDLSGTLDKLVDTADDARPTARELDSTLRELNPALAELRPVAYDLRPVLEDAKPLIDELVPTVDRATEVFDDINGTPLERVNGPILTELNREWKGSGPKYPNGGRDHAKFYEEIGYLVAATDGAGQYMSNSNHLLGFEASVGPTSIDGAGPLPDALTSHLEKMFGIPHQGPNGTASRRPLSGPIVPGTDNLEIPLMGPATRPLAIDPNQPGKGPNR